MPKIADAPVPNFPFSLLSDDLLLTIFSRLDSDPRDWARLSCVSPRFSSLIRNVCYKSKCSRLIPTLAGTGDHPPPGGWSALHKLLICCPGPKHAGVLLENSDFGLELDIGPNHVVQTEERTNPVVVQVQPQSTPVTAMEELMDCEGWTMFDDLYFDTVYDMSESGVAVVVEPQENKSSTAVVPVDEIDGSSNKKRKKTHHAIEETVTTTGVHLAGTSWSPSRDQGNKLLATRLRDDCLYICDWPGCVHPEEKKRDYMLFRGVFMDFKKTGVWRTIMDGGRKSSGLDCAFCGCRDTWDLHSAFCLRRVFGYHDDGEPVVRAFVCQNGHVSGAWTKMSF